MSALNRAIIHHTAGGSDWTTDYETGKAKVRGVQNLHMDANGWCDIGYHFLVNAGGHIYEGRSGSMSGLPRGSHDCANGNSFGFTVLGYYHSPYYHTFTTASQNAIMDVIAWRMPSAWSPYGSSSYSTCEGTKTVGYLDGHNRVVATACPGSEIYNPYITDNRNGGPMRDGVWCRKEGTCGSPPPSAPAPWLFATSCKTLNVINNADGRLEVFAIASDNTLKQIWQTSPNGSWSTWGDNGGWSSAIAPARNQDGRLEVFGVGSDSQIWAKFQTSPGGSWTGWSGRGGNLKGAVRAINNEDGRLEIFAIQNGDNALWHDWQLTPNGSWAGGGSLGGIHFAIGAGRNADARLEVFGIGTDNALWASFQDQPNGTFGGWSSRGGSLKNHVVIAPNADGRLEAVAIGTDNAIWRNNQTAPNGGWAGWTSMGGYALALGIGQNADGRLEIFHIGSDRGMYRANQTAPNSGWTSWAAMGGQCTSIAVGRNADGRIEVFTVGTDGLLYHNWQTPGVGDGWSGWSALSGVTLQQEIHPPPPPPEVIVDNNTSGFSASSNWSTATSATQKYGADYRYRSTAATSDPATWAASLSTSGNHTVYAWWSAGSNRSATAPYVISHSSGSTTVNVNQQINGGQWNSLGSYSLSSGNNSVKLSCWTTTGYVVIADAVKWVKQ